MKQTKTLVQIVQSFWFLPILYGFIAILLAIVAVQIDFSFTTRELEMHLPAVLTPDAKLAAKLFSTLTTATLTMTTITFSTIMVVLTTFSGQFSPRTLQTFIHDRVTQNVLAIFISGFIYDITAFLQIKSPNSEKLFLSPVLAVIISLTAAIVFVFYINHVSKMVQVNNLINRLTKEALQIVNQLDNDIGRFQKREKQNPIKNSNEEEVQEQAITAQRAGYVNLVDFDSLIKLAKKHHTSISMEVYLGDYIVTGTRIMTLYHHSNQLVTEKEKYLRCVQLGIERTGVQDIEFSIQKLDDIILRAISPSTNDPTTAINGINRIGQIFISLGNKTWLQPELNDQKGLQRLTIKQHDLSFYLYKAFFQIRYYCNDDVSVTEAILSTLKRIAEHAPASTHETLWEYGQYIYAGFDKDVLLDFDQTFLEQTLAELAHATGHNVNDILSHS